MLLSDLIERCSNPAFAGEAFAAVDDLVLTARIAEAADAERISSGEYIQRAVDRYVAGSREDEWLTLIALMSRSKDPGEIFLRRAMAAALDGSTGACCADAKIER
ncbi:MAG: hypothetical protein FJX62_12845 [Alphaproteobacteria bacterium]|nr:hypothetical protein [Alphaproteobacteria bacterium]